MNIQQEKEFTQKLKVLDELSMALALLHTLPDETKLGEFIAGTLADVPGIKAGVHCLRNCDYKPNNLFPEIQATTDYLINIPLDQDQFTFSPPERDNLIHFELRTAERSYGYILVIIENIDRFNVFRKSVINFVHIASKEFENRWQKIQLIKHQSHLESLIESRATEIRTEVSVRKLAEGNLDAINLRFANTLEDMTDGFVSLDVNWNYTYVNKKASEMFGRNPVDLVGKNIWTEFPEGIDQPFYKSYYKAVETQQQIIFEDYYPPWNKWFENRVIPSKDGLAIFFQDITKRKLSEEKILQHSDELKSLLSLSNKSNKTMLMDEVIQMAIDEILSNIKPDISYFFLKEEEDLILKRVAPQLAYSSLGDIPEHKIGECMCGLAASEKRPLYSKDIFTDLRCTWDECKDAGYKSFAALPLLIGDEILGIVGLASKEIRDFEQESVFLETLVNQISMNVHNADLYEETIQHAAELESKVEARTQALSQANIRLQELDRLKSIFIASMSHELRTPLNSIIGFTGLLLRGISGQVDEEAIEDLDIVYHSSKHLLSLINDVIDISKIEADKLDVYFEELEIDDVIKEILTNVSEDAKRDKIEIKTKFPAGLIINSDRKRLVQCILNLMSNAIKYTEKGKVELEVENANELLKIIVSDTGIGIKEEDLPKLFNSFVRLETPLTDDVPGTGLGLYLTKKIMTNVFHGEISVTSQYGKGSVFILELPMKNED